MSSRTVPVEGATAYTGGSPRSFLRSPAETVGSAQLLGIQVWEARKEIRSAIFNIMANVSSRLTADGISGLSAQRTPLVLFFQLSQTLSRHGLKLHQAPAFLLHEKPFGKKQMDGVPTHP